MSNILLKFISVFFICLCFLQYGSTQDDASYELGFEVNRVSPKLSISKQELSDSQRLIDLNHRYKADWVKEYSSVQISAVHDGKTKTVASVSDELTAAQIELMKMADIHTDIAVKVSYIPENNLSQNELKEMNFSFMIDPDEEATFIGGEPQLQKYIKTQVANKVSKSDFKIHNLTAVKFSIDERGQVFDTQVVESSGDKKVDSILLDAICGMPAWSPAQYAVGTKVKREFVFTVGDHRSCTINVLDIVAIDKYRAAE